MNVKDKPNTVRGVFEVRASAEFYDDEATVETLRDYIEQLFEDAELDAGVKVLRKQMPAEVISQLQIIRTWADVDRKYGGIKPECCDYIVKWIDDALALLKEQEPVKPELYLVGEPRWKFYRCPVCKMAWYYKGNYCLNCGRPVEWDE